MPKRKSSHTGRGTKRALSSETSPNKFLNRSETVQITHIPTECLIGVFRHLDFVRQQRFHRVSKQWKCVLLSADVLSRTCVDRSTFFGPDGHKLRGLLAKIDRGTITGIKAWKFQCKTTRTLIFNGHFCQMEYCRNRHALFRNLEHESRTADFIVAFATTFANLTDIFLANVVLDHFPFNRKNGLGGAAQICRWKTQGVRVTLVNSFLPALPMALPIYRKSQAPPGVTEAYVIRLPHLVDISDEDRIQQLRRDFSALSWPYPDEQLEWVRRHVMVIKLQKPLMRWLMQVNSWFYPMGSDADKRCDRFACPEHDDFCDHQDIEFYKELNGPHRCLLAVSILTAHAKHPKVGVEGPPCPFRNLGFMKESVNGCRRFVPLGSVEHV